MTEEGESRRVLDLCLSDPAWLPHRVLDEGRVLRLVRLSRADRRELSFIDRRYVSDDLERVEAQVADLVEAFHSCSSRPCHFIFHSAFCCSTLLSRALDVEGVATVLKEPQALSDLSAMMPRSGWPETQKLALGLVLHLLGRPELPGEQTIIKASNAANPLIEHIMELLPNARLLLMYASLPDFLLSVCRRRRWSWARRFAAIYRAHPQFETRATRDLLLLTDLQAAAFLWLQQQAQFARLVRELPAGRVATLRADIFRADPATMLRAVAGHFRLGLNDRQAAQIAAGPVFRSHSKWQGQQFDERILKRDEALVKLAFGPEIERALDWAAGVSADASVPSDLESLTAAEAGPAQIERQS